MLPSPMDLLEADLWQVHARLAEAQAEGRGVGAVDDEAKQLIALYVSAGEAHAVALRRFLQRLRAEVSARETERVAATHAIEQAERDLARFRSHVHRAMREAGIERLKAGPGLLYFGTTPGALREISPSAVPAEYMRVIPARRELRELEIRRALDRGVAVPGIARDPGEALLVVR